MYKRQAEEVVEKDVNTIPRLPIDRVFSLSGFGTIITGTLLAGTISKAVSYTHLTVMGQNGTIG